MPRSLLVCIVSCSLVVSAGCRMCANPYDECGPMAGHGCSQECGANVRAGSVLSGVSGPMDGVGDWAGPIVPPSDGAEAPSPQPKTPTKTETPSPEGWKSSSPLPPQE